VKRVLLVAVVAMGIGASLSACSDMFSPPELPDLFKDPYDFAVVIPPYTGDGGVRDMAGNGGGDHDFSMPTD
jgi:hypothetical protein